MNRWTDADSNALDLAIKSLRRADRFERGLPLTTASHQPVKHKPTTLRAECGPDGQWQIKGKHKGRPVQRRFTTRKAAESFARQLREEGN
ncbi:hypothetical protein ISU10_11235 [Nocardioides agariphilus]|uniref:Uncharacterized protein n=1 Tax=Nocardioides agariphilus TaxID=433664 RepID=A0A930VQZ7_9ACTN|nr:hypothetical protein [Nocardioides agariphilus]MBF4768340.1 hypothetical protein [Nocardioides agariphilus]